MNISFTIPNRMDNMFAYVEIGLPDSREDTKYLRTLFRSSIDTRRFLDGIKGNLWLGFLLEPFIKAATFEVKFPFEKGTYSFINVTFPTDMIPFKDIKARGTFNISAKMSNRPRKVWIFTIISFGKIIWIELINKNWRKIYQRFKLKKNKILKI